MKKIAVITYHRSYNYGAVLQAYATVKFFENQGFDVKIIDYYPQNLRGFGTYKNSFNDVSNANRNFLVRCILTLVKTPGYKKLKKAFDYFIDKELPLTDSFYSLEELKNNLIDFDIYCTGSDQVWNNYYTHNFDVAYFLDFVLDDKAKIAFAASFGKSKFTEEEYSYLREKLSKYDYISVREKTGVDIAKKVGRDDCDLMLDPTLMVEPEIWNDFASKDTIDDKYILVYQLHGDSDTYEQAKKISQQLNFKIVRIITMPHQKSKGCINIVTPDIHQFVSLFKNAEIILTDSFHGTVFSILYSKKLGVTMPKRFGNRITTLLDQLDARELIIHDLEKWSDNDFQALYSKVIPKLSELRYEKNELINKHLEEFK